MEGEEQNLDEPRPSQNFGQSRMSQIQEQVPGALEQDQNKEGQGKNPALQQQPKKIVHNCTYGKLSEAEPTEGFTKEILPLELVEEAHLASAESFEEQDVWPFQDKAKNVEGAKTLFQIFKRNLYRKSNSRMLGTRDKDTYNWLTYRQVADQAEHLSYGLLQLDPPIPELADGDKTYKFFGVLGSNRYESYMIQISCLYQGFTFVSVQQDKNIKFILNMTELSTMAMSLESLKAFAAFKQEDSDGLMAKLTAIIIFENKITDEDKAMAEQAGLTLHTMESIIDKGRHADKELQKINEPLPDSAYVMSYTSGATGDEVKLVPITHKMSLQSAVQIQKRHPLSAQDCYYSHLPQGHQFEQQLFVLSLVYGFKCGFSSSVGPDSMVEDLQILKPTIFCANPATFNQIYHKIQESLKEARGCTYWFVEKCVNSKLDNIEYSGSPTHMFYDPVIFNKIKSMLGGSIRLIFSSYGHVSPEILKFLKICFCVDIVLAYSSAETGGFATMSLVGDSQTGSIGGPLGNFKAKLKTVEELGFLAEEKKGELWLWSPSNFAGYFKQGDKNEVALDGEWVKTGDVAELFENGALKIIDRIINTFKLSGGATITPQKLEGIFIQSEFLDDAWIYGDDQRTHTVAFFVISRKYLLKQAKEKGIGNEKVEEKIAQKLDEEQQINEDQPEAPVVEENEEDKYKEILADLKIKSLVQEDILRLSATHFLKNEEKPKHFELLATPFSPMRGLTTLMTLRRSAVKELLQEKIDKLYLQN